jgi:hypothetical protein
MVPRHVRLLFHDIELDTFVAQDYPDYTIFRVLEWGDQEAVVWMRQIFPKSEIRRVLLTEHRLSPKSAMFWALVYKVQPSTPFVACLSACMMMGELTKYISRCESALDTGFQFDILVGPENGTRKAHERKATCICIERAALIDKMRVSRTTH